MVSLDALEPRGSYVLKTADPKQVGGVSRKYLEWVHGRGENVAYLTKVPDRAVAKLVDLGFTLPRRVAGEQGAGLKKRLDAGVYRVMRDREVGREGNPRIQYYDEYEVRVFPSDVPNMGQADLLEAERSPDYVGNVSGPHVARLNGKIAPFNLLLGAGVLESFAVDLGGGNLIRFLQSLRDHVYDTDRTMLVAMNPKAFDEVTGSRLVSAVPFAEITS